MTDNQAVAPERFADKHFGIFVAVVSIAFFLAIITLYDLTHRDLMKARNACEAVAGRVWVDGIDIRKPSCVEAITNG